MSPAAGPFDEEAAVGQKQGVRPVELPDGGVQLCQQSDVVWVVDRPRSIDPQRGLQPPAADEGLEPGVPRQPDLPPIGREAHGHPAGPRKALQDGVRPAAGGRAEVCEEEIRALGLRPGGDARAAADEGDGVVQLDQLVARPVELVLPGSAVALGVEAVAGPDVRPPAPLVVDPVQTVLRLEVCLKEASRHQVLVVVEAVVEDAFKA